MARDWTVANHRPNFQFYQRGAHRGNWRNWRYVNIASTGGFNHMFELIVVWFGFFTIVCIILYVLKGLSGCYDGGCKCNMCICWDVYCPHPLSCQTTSHDWQVAAIAARACTLSSSLSDEDGTFVITNDSFNGTRILMQCVFLRWQKAEEIEHCCRECMITTLS